MRLEVRAQGSKEEAEKTIRLRIKNVDPNLQIGSISSAQTLIDDEMVQQRLIAKLSSSFSLLALILASIGLYDVMSYSTQRRTIELGIRMALGASRNDVIGMVLKEALMVTLTGLAIPMIAAVCIGRLLAGSLYRISAFDPLTAIIISACIIAAAFLAGWLPARRASRVDPMIALRAG